MNLYLRYFDSEILVHTVDEAIDFLSGIEEIGMDEALERDLRLYAESDIFYPKRYKIRLGFLLLISTGLKPASICLLSLTFPSDYYTL